MPNVPEREREEYHCIGNCSSKPDQSVCYSQASLESKLERAMPKAWTAHIGYLRISFSSSDGGKT